MNTAEANAGQNNAALLSLTEQRALAWRLTMALAAAGCLILSVGLEALNPSQRDVAQLVAGIAAVLVGGPALTAAWRSLQHPDLHGITDQLIALAFIAAWASGDLVTTSLLPLIMTVGHILEERSLLGTHEAIRALTKLTQTTARRIEAAGIVEVAASTLQAGDLIEVRAGDRIPADGCIETGSSSVDTASVTGESLPTEVDVGDTVFSGSINLDGHLTVRLTRVGCETTLGRVIELMREAERSRPLLGFFPVHRRKRSVARESSRAPAIFDHTLNICRRGMPLLRNANCALTSCYRATARLLANSPSCSSTSRKPGSWDGLR
jgi:Cd2+/Zn2+-exporting ATPase